MQSVIANFAQMLPTSPSEGFTPVVTTLEAPPGIQLLSLSVLLLVFAVAATSEDVSEQGNQSKAEEVPGESKVQLVRPDAIAFRSGVATGLIGLLMILPSSPRQGFVPDVTHLESLEGVQFLSVSLLLLVFAMAVNSEEEQSETKESQRTLLRVDAIAFRSAIFVCLLGLTKAFGSSAARVELAFMVRQDFLPSVAILEASEGLQLLSVSLLLLVFALAVCEEATQQEEQTDNKVELVRTEAIAFRLSVMATLIGLVKTFGGLWSVFDQLLPASPSEGFAPAIASVEATEGIQLLAVSFLLLVFAVAVISEDESQTESNTKTPQVELLRADAIAFRSAIVAGLLGLIKTLPASPSEGFAPTMVSMGASEGTHFLCISVLLLVFAVAVKSEEISSEEKPQVELVTAGTIAFRSSIVTGLIGFLKVFANADARAELAAMNQTEFAPEVAMIEAHEGFQLLIVAVLLFVFAAAVNSEDVTDEKVKAEAEESQMLELVRPQTIAFRMAMVAGLIGFLMTIDQGVVALPRVAAAGEIALVLCTGVAVMLSDVPRQLVSV